MHSSWEALYLCENENGIILWMREKDRYRD